MQTRQKQNPANQQMDVDPNEKSDATRPIFYATDPAGLISLPPQTTQQSTILGGLSALLQNPFQGGTADQQVPGQQTPSLFVSPNVTEDFTVLVLFGNSIISLRVAP
jgi:hypothetical protein